MQYYLLGFILFYSVNSFTAVMLYLQFSDACRPYHMLFQKFIGLLLINAFKFSAPSEPLFKKTNILNFDKLVFQRICLMMFKHHIGDVPKPISDLFQTNNNYHSYSTRNSQSLRTPIGKSEAIYQTFTYFGSLAWNYISSKIPTDVSYICFKNIAKLHLQSNNLPQIRLNV